MKSRQIIFKNGFILLLCILGIFVSSPNTLASTISGTVYDNQRNPLVEIDVELLDDLYRLIARTKTSGTGRYEFSGLRNGTFTVRVLPFRYDFIDSSMPVEINAINSISGSTVTSRESNEFVVQDFYLLPKKGGLVETELGVVFAQEVPKEAQRLYDTAIKDIGKKNTDEAIKELKSAVGIFPNYYQALSRLGKELYVKGEYGEALQVLLKASEINPKSPTTFYYLGYSLVKLNYTKAALIPLNQAVILAPSSVQVLYVLGLAEEAEGKYAEAEKHLLQAKKLSKVGIPDIHWQLAQLYGKDMKKYKEAADELELYLKAGKFDEAHITKIKTIISDMRKKSGA